MPQSVRIDDLLIDSARREAKGAHRSVQGQIEHWAKIGQMVERSGVLSYERIRNFLSGEMQIDNLNNDERLMASRTLFDQFIDDDFSSVTDELKERDDSYYGSEDGESIKRYEP
ncbi:hypothetical protein EUZ85_03425 [Hahella sp. KA22]|uniref:ParD-like family protein n=1 Tax=Hahella sp. KA22 TaxID=1628392 RepID=UPI000FDF4453|nr:ParD-like family protein [Hahella sp. KA22]AZZ89807.1 hypothetical protein ENC22_00880 [Hahella sp. KA22]QAY53177.1 hypothetical protein EUZ85_03425 [Hahella sp. KA22]